MPSSIDGHDACSKYFDNAVGDLLLHSAGLNEAAQETLLKKVKPVFTPEDNAMMCRIYNTEEVKESLWSANSNAAPGNDGLTNMVYKHCWDTLGDSLVQVAQAVHGGSSPTLSQKTSLMVYGANAYKPPTSTDPKHKRRISL